MIRQKPLLAIMSCNLIGHPHITLKRQCISGRTFSQNDLKNVRCQTVIIVSDYKTLHINRTFNFDIVHL